MHSVLREICRTVGNLYNAFLRTASDNAAGLCESAGKFIIVGFSWNQGTDPDDFRSVDESPVPDIDAYMRDMPVSEEDQIALLQESRPSYHFFPEQVSCKRSCVLRREVQRVSIHLDRKAGKCLPGGISRQQDPVHEPGHPCQAAAVDTLYGSPSPEIRYADEVFCR